ncbi:hypothetical protein HJG60_002580 [Phyllostomus discolor]|uniref:Immunoglobulin domain-containing protein n=1 Tax=Phyllostomus discolor TaxID=89673 RepID=A0A833YJS8_9CHIR|nr:hypothetical protein HJG60_002580 [Phyllostomus discolor]
MEAPSAPAHRGLSLWKELLLAVSLLSFWSPPTTARLTVESINAAEGEDVLLLAHSLPENLVSYSWYRGERVDSKHQIASYIITLGRILPGPAHSGRETIYSNGALLFQKVTLNDTGYYTVHTVRKDLQTEEATGQLRVYISLLTFWSPPSTARLTVASVNAAEGKGALLLVLNLPENPAGYSWFRGESVDSSRGIGAFLIEPTQKFTPGPAHSGRETIYPNGSLLFQKVALNDTGHYTIVVTKKDFLTEKATGQLTVYRK